MGVYGQDGFLIANDSASAVPSYASASTTAPPYTWVAATTDPRGLYTDATKSSRIESTYYSNSNPGATFTFDVNTTGGSHQIAIYCLDLDSSVRTQTISITDTSGNVLGSSTQTLSNFHNGVYARWNISGHVQVKVTYTGGLNAVVSGLFFSPAVSLGPPPVVSFSSPTASSGTLTGTVQLSATASSTPGVANVQFAVDGNNIGSPVLPPSSGSTYSTSWATTSVASGTHSLTATATDTLGQTSIATLSVNTFNAGPPPPSATFVKTDTATQGSWVGVYGQSGALIANDSQVTPPSYATISTTAPQYTWSASTTAVQALQISSTSGANRIASTYYSSANNGASFTFDLNLTDGNTHQVALYSLDFENFGRAQTINILNASTNAVLDTRTVAGFSAGVWNVWSLTGHVLIQVINTSSSNAAVSGLFFGLPPTPPPAVTITAPTGGTQSGSVNVTATATATSPATIASVQFQLDGTNLGSAVTASPFTVSWDTTKAKNGSHTLTAIATDSNGQHTTSAGVTVTTSNAGPPAPTVSISTPTAGATISGATTVTASVTSTATPVTVQFQVDGVSIGSPVTSPYSISWTPTSANNGSHSLTAIATDNVGQSTTSAAVSVTVSIAGPPAPAATFVKTDTATQGSWLGVYGKDGALIANDSLVTPPSYATISTAAPQYTWSASTTAVQALQISSTSGANRIASTYYSSANSGASFTFDLNLTDGNTHQVALYSLDFENFSRTQTINILNANTNAVLDTRTVGGFGAGVWNVWSLTGHVIIQVINTGSSSNAVVSGLFFSPTPTPPPAVTITAPTGGTQSGSVNVTATATASSPATIASVQFQLDGTNLGSAVTASPFTISWDTTKAKNGSHTLTAIATDSNGQHTTSAGVTVATSNAGPPAPTVSISTPTAGSTISGATTVTASVTSTATPVTVQFQVDGVSIGSPVTSPYSISWTPTSANNGSHSLTAIATDNVGQSTTSAAVSVTVSIAGPPPPSATFVKTDTTTQGSWVGVYGQSGALIANDSQVTPPSYATISTAAPQYTWVPSTTAVQALQISSTSGANRIASTYYSSANNGASFTFDLNLTDGNTHQVALYSLDFENFGRAQTINILNASTNAVLDTRTVAGFSAGVWNVWSLTGHVLIQVINTSSSNAAVSGLFFGLPPTPPPAVTITAPTGGTQSGSVNVTATATASSPATIASVQFQLDGTNLGSAVTASPFTISWDTTKAKNGSHSLTAIATDSNGQHTTSAGVTVTTSNAGPPAPTVSISTPTAGSTISGATTVAANVTSTATPVTVQFQVDGVNIGSPVTSPYSISWTPTSANNGSHSLTAIATDNVGQSTTSAAVSVTVSIAGPPPPSATFIKTDAVTKGSWVGVYGQNGALIANDSQVAAPAYATISTTAPQYTWVPSTTATQALQISSTSGSNRIASSYYSTGNAGATFTFDLNLIDGNSHQVAVYSLDFEGLGRAQTINILNANTNTVMDSRTVANFVNGVWDVWNLTGHVVIQVVNTGGSNAAVSGLFFGPGAVTGPPPTINITAPTAGQTLTGSVTLTASTVSSPGVASVQFLVDGAAIGSAVTSSNSTFSTTWATNSVSNGAHTLTAVATDNLSQMTTSAGVSVTTSNTGPAPATATFVKVDTSTIGNWKGIYGGDGYVIPNDSNVTPPYATAVTVPTSAYTWLPSTNDPRALLKGASLTDRIASTYFTSTSMTFDVNLNDSLTHQFALYLLDLDTNERAETITIKDYNLGTTLSTQTAASFNGGVYEVYKISGHVTVTVTFTGGLNAVVSGVFFGTGAVPPSVTMTAPSAGTVSGTVTLTASASSSVGIASVQFQSDGMNVGSAVTGAGPNFSTSWNTISTSSNGAHAITAIATDKLGQTTTSSPVSVTVSNSGPPPVISITAPTGSTVTGTVTATANATGSVGVKTVQFQVDGVNLGAAVTGSGPTYSTPWNTSSTANGSHTLAAIATDYIGQTTSTSANVNVENGPPPTVSLTAPAQGANVQGSVSLSATAGSSLGAVSVQFQVDGTNLGAPVTGSSPFKSTWDTTKGTNGAHTVTAVATDVLNQTTSSTHNVTVSNPAPVITITNPTAGVVFATENVTATVTSSVGIASVQFKLDGANLGAPLTSAPFSVSWDTTAAANGPHTLSAVATDALNQSTTASPVSVSVSNAGAMFVSFDTTTRGNWTNTYGEEGVVIPNDLTSLPAYATLGLTTATTFTYAASTSDARALLKSAGSTDRIASDFVNVNASTFDLDLNFSDLAIHRVVLYFLDYSSSSPNQSVSILDANSMTVLDTRTLDNTAFQSGEYGLYNISGHVLIRVASHTTNATQTPLVSGIFFQTAPAVSITAPAAGPVSGNVTIKASASSNVGIASVQFQVDGSPIATVNGAGPYSTVWTPTTGGSHTLTAVATDVNGLVTTSAAVTVVVSNSNSTLPGATFVKFDTTTSGSWKGVYGQDGEYIAADTANAPPPYVRPQNLTIVGGTQYSWLDTQPQDCQASRGLQTVGATSGPCNGSGGTTASNQNPSAWYSTTNESIRVTLTDGQAHQLALYCVDFDNTQRAETIQILDANTNAILDQRALSSFHNGVYLVWNITGDVIVKAIYTGATGQGYSDAVMSGLFFRTFTTAPPQVTVTSPSTGSVAGSVALTATASSATGLASVRFQLDGSDLLSTISAPGPYSEPWVTTTTANGNHTLTAIATDTLGQTTVSAPVSITINNGSAPAPAATFVLTDTATSGNWVGTYGSDGFMIANDSFSNPAYYATVNVGGAPNATALLYTYAYPTTDTTALLNSPSSTSSDRIASAYYQLTSGTNNNGIVSIDVNLTDYAQHQVALYFLDWPHGSTRDVQVQVVNASNNAVLDTRTVANYGSGTYLIWKLIGHVKLNVTEIINDQGSAPNTVTVNGIFFDPAH